LRTFNAQSALAESDAPARWEAQLTITIGLNAPVAMRQEAERTRLAENVAAKAGASFAKHREGVMRIHNTIIKEDTVELTIEDANDASEGGVYVMLRSMVKADISRPIAEAQLEALRLAREVISAEMKVLEQLRGRS
jgi:hypothetical protein